LFTAKRVNLLKVAKTSMTGAIEIVALFAAIGAVIQVMTMTGARGLMVIMTLGLTGPFLYLSIAVASPVIAGLLMPFGAAGVLGVPLAMAFLDLDAIWVTSALSLLLGVGALLPPTAVSGLFAAQSVGVEKYSDILKKCAVPAVLCLIVGVTVLLYA